MKHFIKHILYKNGVVIRMKEPWMNNYTWLKQLNINTVIDIGANEGQFAKQIRQILPNAFIHSFEPIKKVYEVMEKNLADDRYSKLYNIGLGSEEANLDMNVNAFSPSSSLLELDKIHLENYSYAAKTHKESIIIKKLDAIINKNDVEKNILIKVDVQGYEDKVILGGEEIFKKATVAIIETSFKMMYKNQMLFDEIYTLMRNLGYEYKGNFGEQNYDNRMGDVLFSDSIFIKK